jgi:serine/tyrosine/threonine adenylyltransferase
MEEHQADYTNTFLALQADSTALSFKIYNQESFKQWVSKWRALLIEKNILISDALQFMKGNNPIFIPRNHLVEKALNDACQGNDYVLFNQLLKLVSNPYQSHKEFTEYQNPPNNGDGLYKTYCGT